MHRLKRSPPGRRSVKNCHGFGYNMSMLSMFNLAIDAKGLEKAQQALAHMPGAFKRAQSRALRYVMRSLKSETVKNTKTQYHIKNSDLSGAMRASVSAQTGTLHVRGPRLGLEKYYLSPKTPGKRRRSKGLMGAVRRDTGTKRLPGAFLIKLGRAGRYYPYERVGSERWDIKRIMSPAAAQLVRTVYMKEGWNAYEAAVGSTQDSLAKKFDERLRHEIMYELGAFAK